ncbi:glycosyltransferase [Chloroflexi bacterium TSY]|nr:glycosyltransferase [Chloroflexi bacterium TSY]
MSKIAASIIIPTYNRKESLIETLDSLTSQENVEGDFEVIVVDDGSSDGTEQIESVSYPFILLDRGWFILAG